MKKMDSESVVYLNADDDLQAVLACFKVNKISHVPVMSEDKLIGIVSKTDVVEHLYEAIEKKSGELYKDILNETKVKELMIQPIIEAKVNDSQLTILEKLISHKVGSVVLKNDEGIAGIVTERDMLCYIAKELEGSLSLSEKLGIHIVQWLERNGLFRVSQMLADIGI